MAKAKPIRRKSMKRQSLGFLAEWRLRHRGKKDARRKIVRVDTGMQCISPFLNQELRLCKAEMKEEKEVLAQIVLRECTAMKTAQLEIQRQSSLRDENDDPRGSKRAEGLRRSINAAMVTEERCQLAIEKETEITKLRCQQRYELLQARLSAYWSGVLGAPQTQEFPPLYAIEGLFDNIIAEIETLPGGDGNG